MRCWLENARPTNRLCSVDSALPALPERVQLTRLLLEYSLHLPAIDVLSTIREEDSLLVEGAYLEGWALYLQAEALDANPPQPGRLEEDEEADLDLTAPECYAQAMRSLQECARLFEEQDYPDEGIGAHVKQLLENLERRGVKPSEGEDDTDEGVEQWEDVNDQHGDEEKDRDVDMA